LHCEVTGAGHEPAPSHVAAAVAVPPVQLAPRQEVLVSGNAQAAVFEPSHAPPQAVPAPVQALRGACGSPLTATQVPTLPGTSHASHWPLQAWLQQTPSAQLPSMHSSAAWQAAPAIFFGAQLPPAVQ